jgi:hypothetical protein
MSAVSIGGLQYTSTKWHEKTKNSFPLVEYYTEPKDVENNRKWETIYKIQIEAFRQYIELTPCFRTCPDHTDFVEAVKNEIRLCPNYFPPFAYDSNVGRILERPHTLNILDYLKKEKPRCEVCFRTITSRMFTRIYADFENLAKLASKSKNY